MECPKCHKIISDNATVCPHCRKVLALECPNCHSLSESSVCEKCGYTILVKCAKCAKLNHISQEKCSKCKFPVKTSLANNECENDEFAALTIKFNGLKDLKRILKSPELAAKFTYKLKNLLYAQLKGVECKSVVYGDTYVVNMSKELSLGTSSNKAVRLALKIINAFAELNANTYEEFGKPLNLSINISRKNAEQLLDKIDNDNNVKMLTVKKNEKKFLKGFSLVIDQFIYDEVNKNYKTDSLYTIETAGMTTMYYEVVLDSYVVPPSAKAESKNINVSQTNIKSNVVAEEEDIYSFKVFDLNVNCSFETIPTINLLEKFEAIDFQLGGQIVGLRSESENRYPIEDIKQDLEKRGLNVYSVSCTEELNYTPWGFFRELMKDYFGLSCIQEFDDYSNIDTLTLASLNPLFDLLKNVPIKASSSDDARFAYMEHWANLLSMMTNTVIIVEDFDKLDDTSIQTLEIYFDKFKKVKPNFIFVTPMEVSLHSKFKGLLKTKNYKEYILKNSSIDSCLASLKADAVDFIQSFFYEKIKDNFKGSFLYFKKAIEYLKAAGILVDFENKLIVKNKKTIILPDTLEGLYKSKIKVFNNNMDASLLIANSSILGARIDFKTLAQLGIKNIEKNVKELMQEGLVYCNGETVYVNNFSIIKRVLDASLKNDSLAYIAKNIIGQLGKALDDTTMFVAMGKLGAFREEYLTLWKNSRFALAVGDYDAYLKNTFGFLSLTEQIESYIEKADMEENKKEVYNSILASLCNYSPIKIYPIAKLLLTDAIKKDDSESIVKLSNLMLQGALVSSNYSDAMNLLHNIMSKMTDAAIIVDGVLNPKFLLLLLVKIEILYNIGNYTECIEVGNEILHVLSKDVIKNIRPEGFSMNLFVSHIQETMRLVAFAKLWILDNDLDEFLNNINQTLEIEFSEKDCILAIRDYLAGRLYSTGVIEDYSPFAKTVFLILQEFSVLENDYKRFAQNVYQAKQLAIDIHQRDLELFCDLLIAYAYYKIGITKKAEYIYKDVLREAEESAKLSLIALAKYFIAEMEFSTNKVEKALLTTNEALALVGRNSNNPKAIYVLLQKLYIEIVRKQKLTSVDIDAEENKISFAKEALARFFQ